MSLDFTNFFKNGLLAVHPPETLGVGEWEWDRTRKGRSVQDQTEVVEDGDYQPVCNIKVIVPDSQAEQGIRQGHQPAQWGES